MLRHTTASDWRDAVAYQVFVRSFRDSNGDRVGDFGGLSEQLDVLRELGVTALWLNPIFPSDSHHNYFAADLFDTDPEYGTLEDFAALCRAVHARDMRLLIDVEAQYLPRAHPIVRGALAGADSARHDWILYKAGVDPPEPVRLVLRMGSGPEASVFEVRDAVTLNLDHPEVRAWQERLFGFWLDPLGTGDRDAGVDGYRLDHVMDDLDGLGRLTGLYARFWRPLLEAVRRREPQLFWVAEPADWSSLGARLLSEAGIDAVFAMPLMGALRDRDGPQLVETVRRTLGALPEGRHAFTILENHDVDRFATAVGGAAGALRAGAALLLTLPGVPTLYAGQELGMVGKVGTGAADYHLPAREAFKWTADVDAPGMATWYRDRPFWAHSALTSPDPPPLDAQRADLGSLWHWYRRLIALRREHPALRRGDFDPLDSDSADVVAFARRGGGDPSNDDRVDAVAVVVNRSAQARRAAVDLGALGGRALSVLVADAEGRETRRGELGETLELAPWEVVVARAR